MDLNLKCSAFLAIDAAATEYGVSVKDIFSDIRLRDVSEARHAAMAVVVKSVGYSYAEAAKFFGRDRASIIYAVNKVRDLASVERRTRRHIEAIKSAIGK